MILSFTTSAFWSGNFPECEARGTRLNSSPKVGIYLTIKGNENANF